jgi:radical SAM protein with 4Fe4S-binding SPASM domain
MEPTFSSRLVAVAIITAPDQAAIASAAAILARVGRAVHLVMFGRITTNPAGHISQQLRERHAAMTAKYIVPPERYSFERGSRYLLFDPANFIWFVTDDKGKAIVDGLSQAQGLEAAAATLAHLVGANPQSIEITSYLEKFIHYLVKIGFLHQDEYKPAQLPNGVADRPQVLYIHLTNKCNLRCPYCYNQEHRTELIQIGKEHGSSKVSTEGRTDDFLRIIDEAAQLGFFEVKLTGGEATLNKDFLLMAAHARSKGMRVNLLTNGTLVTPELAREIAAVVDSVSISVDSANPEEHDAVRGRGTHAKAINAFSLLREAGAKFLHVNAVITPINVDSAGKFLDYAFNTLKADRVTTAGTDIVVDDPKGRWGAGSFQLTQEQQYRFFEQSRDFYRNRATECPVNVSRSSIFRRQCGAGNGVVSMDANGDIYPCQTLHRPEFCCGNAFASGLGPILKQSRVLREAKCALVDVLPQCRECAVRYICGGGCRSEAYSKEGDYLAWNKEMCQIFFATAVDKLWKLATVPVQDSEKVVAKDDGQQRHTN